MSTEKEIQASSNLAARAKYGGTELHIAAHPHNKLSTTSTTLLKFHPNEIEQNARELLRV